MNRPEAREKGWDVFFLPSKEMAEAFARTHAAVTGRPAEAFEDQLSHFTVHCVAVAPRPHPVVKVRL